GCGEQGLVPKLDVGERRDQISGRKNAVSSRRRCERPVNAMPLIPLGEVSFWIRGENRSRVHSEWAKNTIGQELRIWNAGDSRNDRADDVIAAIAVCVVLSRCEIERSPIEVLDERLLIHPPVDWALSGFVVDRNAATHRQ